MSTSTMSRVRTRFAPSPTGFLHIGSLRTALYNYLFARQSGGDFVLRIEDTDRARLVEGGVENIIQTLARTGLDYDEGPILAKDGKTADKGNFGPYTQSERTDIYRDYAQKLVEEGKAYYCFCSSERLTEMREKQQANQQSPKYDRCCLELSEEEARKQLADGVEHVIRLKVPEGKTSFNDVIRGQVEFDSAEIDDQVLMKSDGFPTYHLANVVDDHLMKITHVIRGEEWLPSTPKHVILYQAFGWDIPTFAHLPLLLNPDKSKLSKRQGDVAAEDYLAKGYLPEALTNFIALLGFNPRDDEEVYSLEELVKEFDLTKINKGGAVFNVEKLDWLNGHYIRDMATADLVEKLKPFWQRAGLDYGARDNDYLAKVARLEQTRIKRLDEVGEGDFYFSQPEYEGTMLIWKKSDKLKTMAVLDKLIEFFSNLEDNDYSSEENIEQAIRGFVESEGLDNGSVLWPIRVAMSGKQASPSPFELTYLFGKEEIISRLKKAATLL